VAGKILFAGKTPDFGYHTSLEYPSAARALSAFFERTIAG
jgi:hypothetical protein